MSNVLLGLDDPKIRAQWRDGILTVAVLRQQSLCASAHPSPVWNDIPPSSALAW